MCVKQATLKDVARLAGVDPSTVSRILNDRMTMPLRSATIERVKKAARDLRYSPHAIARGLVHQRTHTLGIQCVPVSDPHYARMIEDAERYARSQQYFTLLISSHGDIGSRLLAERRIDGLIAVGRCWETEPRSESAISPEASIVYVGPSEYRPPMPAGMSSVEWSDSEGGRIMAEHLLSLGHTEFAVIAGSAETTHAKVRGFAETILKNGHRVEILISRDESDSYRTGGQVLEEIHLRHPDVTAIFCRNDLLAIGAISRAAELRIAVPERLSITGYSNVPVAPHIVPSLTTVATPMVEAGLLALQTLIQRLKEGKAGSPGFVLSPTLVVRASSASPSAASACDSLKRR